MKSDILRILLVFLLFAGTMNSCVTSYSVVDFEVLEPATVSFPPDVERILFLNRAPLSFNIFEEQDRRGLDEKQLVVLDTLIINHLRKGLESSLKQTPIERFNAAVWTEERRTDTTAFREMALTKREVVQICEEKKVQAIISLEAYFMDLKDHEEHYDDNRLVASRYYEISTKLYWNIYLKNSLRPHDSYTMTDTLFFTEVQDGLVVRYYSPAEMLRETFLSAGKKYGRYLVPVWYPASRILYKGKDDSLKLAASFTDEGSWEEAFAIWEELGNGPDSTLAAKALNNMAIYYELDDHLDSASILLDRGLALDSLDLLKEYRDELDTRIENRKELNKQVH